MPFGFDQGGKYYLFILIFALMVSLATQILLPEPYGIFVALGIFFSFPFIIRRMNIAKFGGLSGKFGGLEGTAKLTKTCTVCGAKAKGSECKKCGSKQFRMS